MAAPGDVLADRYRLDRMVGSGAMGLVWEAWDLRLERRVALKQLRPPAGLSGAEEALANERAMREARITARLHHRYAVPVFDVVEHDGQPCLVMQYIPSVPLASVLKEGGPLRPGEAAQVGAQVGSALAAAHEVGIVHRDVKPGNILVTDDGSALISDFGISHALGDATLTDTGMVHGTPAYLAPEVAQGLEASYASDVFSLGATLYAALEGTPPFGSEANSIVLLHRVAAGRYDPPQRSGALTPLLVSMLSTGPADRPTMATVARALSGFAPSEGVGEPTVLLAATSPSIDDDDTHPAPAAVVESPAAVAPPPPPAVPPPPVGDPTPTRLVASTGDVSPVPRRAGVVVALAVAAVAVLAVVAVLVVRDLGGTDATVGAPPAATTVTAPSRSAADPSTSASRRASSSSRESVSRTGSESSAATSGTESESESESESTTQSPSRAASTAEPTESKTSADTTKVSDSDLAGAIRDYYALLPSNTDAAWLGMTSSYQSSHAGGRSSYNRFWGDIRRVSTSKVTGAAPDRAEARITYVYRDGRRVRELTAFRLVKDGDRLKINDSTVLESS